MKIHPTSIPSEIPGTSVAIHMTQRSLLLSHEQPVEIVQPLSTETIRLTHCAVCKWSPTYVTLAYGQAGILILANDIPLDEKKCSELGRATNADAQVVFGEGHTVFQTTRGVDALLRFHLWSHFCSKISSLSAVWKRNSLRIRSNIKSVEVVSISHFLVTLSLLLRFHG